MCEKPITHKADYPQVLLTVFMDKQAMPVCNRGSRRRAVSPGCRQRKKRYDECVLVNWCLEVAGTGATAAPRAERNQEQLITCTFEGLTWVGIGAAGPFM